MLLLDRLTFVAAPAFAELMVRVQVSDPDPVIDPWLHVIPLGELGAEGFVPVPLRLIAAVGLDEELLAIDNWPELEPAAVGSKCTLRVAVLPGSNVTGKDRPEMENPVPLAEAELMVTGAVPEDVRVTDFVAVVLIVSLPNAILLAPRVRVGVYGLSWSANVALAPLIVAVNVAV